VTSVVLHGLYIDDEDEKRIDVAHYLEKDKGTMMPNRIDCPTGNHVDDSKAVSHCPQRLALSAIGAIVASSIFMDRLGRAACA
jgi:hypothetical protein